MSEAKIVPMAELRRRMTALVARKVTTWKGTAYLDMRGIAGPMNACVPCWRGRGIYFPTAEGAICPSCGHPHPAPAGARYLPPWQREKKETKDKSRLDAIQE